MLWLQRQIILKPKKRGFHLITDEVKVQLPELIQYSAGIAHLFIQHTSASLSINENTSSDVRTDLEFYFTKLVPENIDLYNHSSEGVDDMPAHIKSSILGASLSIPITKGKFNLGEWQGIYICEHRNRAVNRHIIVTLYGQCQTA